MSNSDLTIWPYNDLAADDTFVDHTKQFCPEVCAIIIDLLPEIYKIIYILLTKREGRTGRISVQGLDSTDRAQRGPYKKKTKGWYSPTTVPSKLG